MKQTQKVIPRWQLAVTVVSLLASVLIIILATLQLTQVWENAIYAYMPLIGIVNLCHACLHWEKNRKLAYFSAGTAAFIFICALLVWFL